MINKRYKNIRIYRVKENTRMLTRISQKNPPNNDGIFLLMNSAFIVILGLGDDRFKS